MSFKIVYMLLRYVGVVYNPKLSLRNELVTCRMVVRHDCGLVTVTRPQSLKNLVWCKYCASQ